jgi:hypothetical protein
MTFDDNTMVDNKKNEEKFLNRDPESALGTRRVPPGPGGPALGSRGTQAS